MLKLGRTRLAIELTSNLVSALSKSKEYLHLLNDLKCQFVCTNTSTHPWLDDGTSLLSLIRNLAGILLPSAPSDISESSPLKEMLQRGRSKNMGSVLV